MSLPRLRELLAAWQDGSIREAELHELRDALPEVFRTLVTLRIDATYCAKALLVSVDWIEENNIDETGACDEHRTRAQQALDSMR